LVCGAERHDAAGVTVTGTSRRPRAPGSWEDAGLRAAHRPWARLDRSVALGRQPRRRRCSKHPAVDPPGWW